jgi:hypothetical protein
MRVEMRSLLTSKRHFLRSSNTSSRSIQPFGGSPWKKLRESRGGRGEIRRTDAAMKAPGVNPSN